MVGQKNDSDGAERFWETKQLSEMTKTEWEQLCDGCAKCCLIQLEDEENSVRHFTRVSCKLLDIGVCRCTQYQARFEKVPDCLQVTPELLEKATWLPDTCAYRLIYEGKPLAWWHPLVSGAPETVHTAGISVRNLAVSEKELSPASDLFDYIEPDI